MWKMLNQARKRFDRDQRGNVAVLFAFSMVPLIGLLGGAVDVARQQRYKTEILNAMDATVLAVARQDPATDAAATTLANDYIRPMLPGHGAEPMLRLARFTADKRDGGYRLTVTGSMDTAFLPVVGISSLPLDLASEVAISGGKYEIALALDNTGSMRSHGRIEALRSAASQLVDDLYRDAGAEERVRMALVPFVTAVNVKSASGFDMDWIDPSGDPAIFGKSFSKPVNRLDLFRTMGSQWRGCVEARAEHDEDDTAPTSAATRWVPYLWPDEPDGRGYGNSYLRDSSTRNEVDRLRDVGKYTTRPSLDTIADGPNAACPRPIVPLTNDTALMQDEIRQMRPHNGVGNNNSGTNIAQGLVWGWRVLSPGEPFTEGAAYTDEETQKVLVLLSDGRNQVVANREMTGSDYTSFGYLAEGRMGSTDDYLAAERNVDARVKRVCENVKRSGIRLYTILFQVDYAKTQDLFRDCASKGDDGKPLYSYAPDAAALTAAFAGIGADLTTMHISR